MFKKYSIILLFLILALFVATPSSAFWWMGYHKPAFNGRVLDAETKEPIESAVVVAVYDKQIITGPESNSVIMDVRETLTDKNGGFHIPSYTTVVQPLSWEGDVSFIIYKPGYGSFPRYRIKPPLGMNMSLQALEDFFSKEHVGIVGELRWDVGKTEVAFGIVELPRLKTREERLRAVPSSPTDYRSKHLPLLYKAINEERGRFGLGEIR